MGSGSAVGALVPVQLLLQGPDGTLQGNPNSDSGYFTTRTFIMVQVSQRVLFQVIQMLARNTETTMPARPMGVIEICVTKHPGMLVRTARGIPSRMSGEGGFVSRRG